MANAVLPFGVPITSLSKHHLQLKKLNMQFLGTCILLGKLLSHWNQSSVLPHCDNSVKMINVKNLLFLSVWLLNLPEDRLFIINRNTQKCVQLKTIYHFIGYRKCVIDLTAMIIVGHDRKRFHLCGSQGFFRSSSVFQDGGWECFD